jgi:hypothetical protein
MAGYFFNDEFSTPDAIDRRRALINALSKENLSTAPVLVDESNMLNMNDFYLTLVFSSR